MSARCAQALAMISSFLSLLVCPSRPVWFTLAWYSSLFSRAASTVPPLFQCHACDKPPVTTYVLTETSVGACDEHRCEWFEELQETRGLTEEDLRRVSAEYLVEALHAELL